MTMTTWGLAVVATADGDTWSVATVSAADDAQYDALATRFKQAGMKRVNTREWNRGLWSPTSCSVTVVNGFLTEVHTGRSRILCVPPSDVSPAWQAAAARGRVVLALLRPDTFASVEDAPAEIPPGYVDLAAQRVEAEAAAGRLIAGLATVLDHPAPVPH